MQVFTEKEKDLELNPDEVKEQFEKIGAKFSPEIDPVEALDKLIRWLKKKVDEII